MSASALDNLRSIENLRSIWRDYWRSNSKTAAGIDWITPKAFNDDLNRQLRLLRNDIVEGYTYSALRAIPIPKKNSDKKRLICIPTVRDRLVQRAVLQKIENRAEQLGIANEVSFGFVKDSGNIRRGAHAARKLAIDQRQKNAWAFKADISSFFDSIKRPELIGNFKSAFKLKSLEYLISNAIRCEVDDRDAAIRRVLKDNEIISGIGLRQGMPLSPILSNFVLRDFDKAFQTHGYRLVRYADDLIVLAQSEDECLKIQDLTNVELDKLGLKVSKTKTMICAPNEPVEFLGMELRPKGNGAGYCLMISDSQIQEVRKSFADYHDWGVAQREGLDIASLFRRLERMRNGYSTAYGAADNISDFNQRLANWTQNCANNIYASIFGRKTVDRLSAKQKLFLMLPSTVKR